MVGLFVGEDFFGLAAAATAGGAVFLPLVRFSPLIVG
jgi:hypothetical protein